MPQVIDLRKTKKNPKKTSQEPPTKSAKKTKRIKVKTSKTKKPGPTKIEWTAPEFKKYKKGKKWFILPALIGLGILIIAILSKNFLLAIATILAAFVVYLYALKKPRKIKFSISGKGIQVAKNIYRFEDLKSFWIFYEPPEVKEISIRSKKTFIPYVKIPLGDQNPVEIRKFLLKFLPERRHPESVIDEWMRKARF